MADLVYARPSDNIAALGSLSSSTLLSGTVAQFVDLDPASAPVFDAVSPNSWAITWDFSGYAAYTPIKWLLLFGTTFTAHANRSMFFQAHTSNSWGAPTVNQSVTLPTLAGHGFPQSLAVDLSGVSGYTSALVWVRLLFSIVTEVGSAPPVIGDIVMATTRRTIRNFASGLTQASRYPSTVHTTPAGRRLAYSENIRQRDVTGEQAWSDADWLSLELLAASAKGNVTPFPIQLETTVEPLLVTFETDLARARISPNVNEGQTITLREVVNDRVA